MMTRQEQQDAQLKESPPQPTGSNIVLLSLIINLLINLFISLLNLMSIIIVNLFIFILMSIVIVLLIIFTRRRLQALGGRPYIRRSSSPCIPGETSGGNGHLSCPSSNIRHYLSSKSSYISLKSRSFFSELAELPA
jgi:hypothetical protein